MTAVLDAGALIALEHGHRQLAAQLKTMRREGETAITHGGVIAQVWRGGRRQELLAIALRAIDVTPLDGALGRSAGALLALAGTSDAIDAALVAAAREGDVIYTSDERDIVHLLQAGMVDADVVAL